MTTNLRHSTSARCNGKADVVKPASGLRRRLLMAGAALAGAIGISVGTTAAIEQDAEASGYCSLPADGAGVFGPDSDTWTLWGAWDRTDLYVGWVCAWHDQCYNGDFGYYRSWCDAEFKRMLLVNCDYHFDDEWGWPDKLEQCNANAEMWYQGVRALGGSHWSGPGYLND